VLRAFEIGTAEVLARLSGLTDHEYLWEPVDDCWSIRPVGDRFVADFTPEAEPAPFTTIAWRLWHIALDCLESYSRRAFGAPATTIPEPEFVGTAGEAIATLEQTANHFLNGIRSMGGDVGRPIGPEFGPFAQASYVDLALHAYREVVHHGAEVGVLRDLYERRTAT
jgi:hypothetical protein